MRFNSKYARDLCALSHLLTLGKIKYKNKAVKGSILQTRPQKGQGVPSSSWGGEKVCWCYSVLVTESFCRSWLNKPRFSLPPSALFLLVPFFPYLKHIIIQATESLAQSSGEPDVLCVQRGTAGLAKSVCGSLILIPPSLFLPSPSYCYTENFLYVILKLTCKSAALKPCY